MNKDSKGQALLLVIAAMTVALALGINVSMRTLQSISRTSRTDTSERILGAAEGGLERALNLAPGVLDGGINNADDCGLMGDNADYDESLDTCVVTFAGGTGDPIDARALVVVDDFKWTDPDNYSYKFKLEQDSVTEVNVEGMTSTDSIDICWTPVDKADVYFIFYGDSGVLLKQGWRSKNPSSPGNPYSPNNFEAGVDPSGAGKTYCTRPFSPPTSPSSPKGLRIRSIGGDSTIEVISDALPNQGYKIVSTGELSLESGEKSRKVITVYKSLPFLPGIFDFNIMSNQGSMLY